MKTVGTAMRSFDKHQQGLVCNGCNDRLEQAEQYLTDWFHAQKAKDNSIHCSWAHREEDEQNHAFDIGESKLKWPLSKHNAMPSQALDLFQIDANGKAFWNPMTYAKINDESKQDGYKLKWGGEFKMLGDYCHFEMVKV